MNSHYGKYLLGIIIIILLSSGKCSDNYNYNKIQSLLERANLVLLLPKQYKIVPIIENYQVHYDIAYRLNCDGEVRYSICPYDSLLDSYNAYLDRKAKGTKLIDSVNGEYTETMVDPNTCYVTFFISYIFNISEKNDSTMKKSIDGYHEFPLEDVKKEFNADYGAFAWCELDKEFGQNFKVCNIFMIHKKDYGMVVCFWLYKDWDHVKSIIKNKDITNDFYDIQFYREIPPEQLHPKGINRIILNAHKL